MTAKVFRVIAIVVALTAGTAFAEPFETNPNLAVSDTDFAAGKAAMDKIGRASCRERV